MATSVKSVANTQRFLGSLSTNTLIVTPTIVSQQPLLLTNTSSRAEFSSPPQTVPSASTTKLNITLPMYPEYDGGNNAIRYPYDGVYCVIAHVRWDSGGSGDIAINISNVQIINTVVQRLNDYYKIMYYINAPKNATSIIQLVNGLGFAIEGVATYGHVIPIHYT